MQDWTQEEFIAYMQENQLTEEERKDDQASKNINKVLNNEVYFEELLNLKEDPNREQWQTNLNDDEWEMVKQVFELLS
jgi:hypothetical protein